MTAEELRIACEQYMAEKRAEEAQVWTGHLSITPDMVAEILDSNKEE